MSPRAPSRLEPSAAVARRLLLPSLLAALALLEVWRGHRLAGPDPWQAATAAERGWRLWSDRQPGLDARLEELGAGLAPGEELALVLPVGTDLADWWRVRVLYGLPDQKLVRVVEVDRAPELPRALTRVWVAADGEVAVERRERKRRGGR
jgi:hypothetical protein